MIRGDQLLLALDVLNVWIPHYELAGRNRIFSRSAVLKRLQRYRLDDADPNCKKVVEQIYRGSLLSLHCFLLTATNLPAVEFNYKNAIHNAMEKEFVVGFSSRLKFFDYFFNFLRAIASGELTEADFRD